MKKVILSLIITIVSINLYAQSNNFLTDTIFQNTDSLILEICDTLETQINKTEKYITITQIPSTWILVNKERYEREFNGHWASVQFGINGFSTNNYNAYTPSEGIPSNFMEIKQSSSWEVNLNFAEWNIVLNPQKNLGIVTGAGIGWNNYKFDNAITIIRNDDGQIIPQKISESNFRKSKLIASYLNIPLILEYQFKVNNNKQKMFVSAGILGGLNIGSHTKIKTNNTKDKNKNSLALNPFKYSGIFQIGGNNISIYATYSFSKLFKNNAGPELTPFSIGINLINF